MAGHRARLLGGALAVVTFVACSSNQATPNASTTPPSAPSTGVTTRAPTGTLPGSTAAPGTAAPGTVPPGTATSTPTGPPQPWGEGGATMVQFASLGRPSYTIGAPAADAEGTLWFDAGTVGQRCLNQFDPASTDLASVVRPLGQVATSADGSVWYTTEHGVVRQDTEGTGVPYDVGAVVGSEQVARPITVDREGRAWVTLTEANAIARIGPDGPVTRFTAGIPAGASPGTIDAAADGSVWFTEPDVHQIGHASADGTIEQIDVGGAPEVVVAAPDGGAWFFDSADGSLGRIEARGAVRRVPNATVSSRVVDMAVAPDGSVWYVADPGIVGRFGEGLPLQELPIVDGRGNTTGAPFHHPEGITAAADGTMWFTDSFSGGEGSTISLYAVVAGDAPSTWPDELPVDRPIGATLSTCGDG